MDAGAYVANMGSGIHFPLSHSERECSIYPSVKPEEDLWVYCLTDVWCQSKIQYVIFVQHVIVT